MEYSILVVDDQPDNIKNIVSLLHEMELGNKLYSAPNGKIGLQLAEKYNPDLIISDWEMPEMNGLEFVKALKSSVNTKDIPFVMITAIKIEPSSLKESFDAGVHDYLRKPFNKVEFMSRVRATLKFHAAFLKLKKSKLELSIQADVISKQNIELKKLNQLKDKIFSIISHDIRSPLATLEGLLNILDFSNLNLDEQYAKYFKQVENKVNNVTSFLNNLLVWSKSQLENRKLRNSEFYLSDSINEIIELLNDKSEEKGNQIINNIADKKNLNGNKDAVSFIVRNLIDNAIKFTPKGGSIIISSDSNEKEIFITVEDSGVGMNKEVIKNLNDNGEIYSEKGTNGELGTGLGLKLCKDFAKQLNGDLLFESKKGKGTKISLVLPNKKKVLVNTN